MQMRNDPADIMKKITRHVVSIDNEGMGIRVQRRHVNQRWLRTRVGYANGARNFIYYHIRRYVGALRPSFDAGSIRNKPAGVTECGVLAKSATQILSTWYINAGVKNARAHMPAVRAHVRRVSEIPTSILAIILFLFFFFKSTK